MCQGRGTRWTSYGAVRLLLRADLRIGTWGSLEEVKHGSQDVTPELIILLTAVQESRDECRGNLVYSASITVTYMQQYPHPPTPTPSPTHTHTPTALNYVSQPTNPFLLYLMDGKWGLGSQGVPPGGKKGRQGHWNR